MHAMHMYSKGKLAKPALVQPTVLSYLSERLLLSTSSSLPLSSQTAYVYRMRLNFCRVYTSWIPYSQISHF